jgi:hypothetical protein
VTTSWARITGNIAVALIIDTNGVSVDAQLTRKGKILRIFTI